MENVFSLRDIMKKGDWLAKIDLKDAYLTVPMAKAHQKYLRFQWQGKVYEFKSLPFGLATAPITFTELLRPVVAFLRQQGVRLVVYLDGILVMAGTQELLQTHLQLTMSLLTNLGFMVNLKKCILTPLQTTGVSGFHSGQSRFLSVCSPRQDYQNQERMLTSAQPGKNIRKDIGSHYWPFVISHTSGTSGFSALSESTASEVNSFATIRSTKPRLRHHSSPQPGGSTRFDMVDGVFFSGETTPPMASASPNNRVRCVIERLGSPFNSQAADSWGNLEPRRIGTPHQLVGAKSCVLGIASICSEPLQCPHSSADGQYCCYSLLESSGGNQILRSVLTSNLNLEN